MNDKKQISPKQLYPLNKIEYVNPEQLKKTVETMRDGETDEFWVEVIEYQGFYFIYEGDYIMLAANIVEQPYVNVEVLNRKKLGFWKNDDELKYQLSCIGMCALHDFEDVGRFRYAEYPDWYK